MAHVGKFYKLWFRRDTSIGGATHRGAQAECVKCTLSQLSGGDGVHLNGLVFLCINLSKGVQPWKWLSDPTPFGSIFYEMEFSWINDPNLGWTKNQLIVRRSGTGEIMKGTFERTAPNISFSVWSWPLAAANFVLAPTVVIPPGFSQLKTEPARWDVYNPA